MELVSHHPLIDSILEEHKAALGADFDKYRNHLYRVYNFALYFNKGEDADILAVAAAFHDIGIWTANTFDYLKPSIALAVAYANNNPQRYLSAEKLTQVIDLHHKITPVKFNTTANNFRKADICDLTFSALRFGMPKAFVKEVNAAFPYLGFHRKLVVLTGRQFLKKPWNPLPMFKL